MTSKLEEVLRDSARTIQDSREIELLTNSRHSGVWSSHDYTLAWFLIQRREFRIAGVDKTTGEPFAGILRRVMWYKENNGSRTAGIWIETYEGATVPFRSVDVEFYGFNLNEVSLGDDKD